MCLSVYSMRIKMFMVDHFAVCTHIHSQSTEKNKQELGSFCLSSFTFDESNALHWFRSKALFVFAFFSFHSKDLQYVIYTNTHPQQHMNRKIVLNVVAKKKENNKINFNFDTIRIKRKLKHQFAYIRTAISNHTLL